MLLFSNNKTRQLAVQRLLTKIINSNRRTLDALRERPRGALRVEHRGGIIDVQAGQGIHALKGEWIRYSSPAPGGADYIAVCIPAFSPDTVQRDA